MTDKAETLDKRYHPDALLREVLRDTGRDWAKTSMEPIWPEYWSLWCNHFDRLFREKPDADQARAIYVELRRRGFTNLQLRTAAEHVVSRCRKWPFVADFLDGVKDSSEQG